MSVSVAFLVRIQSESGKVQTRKTQYGHDTFQAVLKTIVTRKQDINFAIIKNLS